MNIPINIKRKIVFNKLLIIGAGILLLIFLLIAKQHLTETPSFQIDLLTSTFIVSYILIIIFLILYPVFLLVFNIDTKRIIKTMKKNGFSERDLFLDYTAASKHGKTKIGKLCTYSNTFYRYYIVPNKKILTVTKKIKERKLNKNVQYKNGATQRTLYNISTQKQFFVNITDIYGKTISIFCNKETTADEVISFYHQFPNILFIDPQSRTAKKQAQEIRKKLLDEERNNNEK